MKYITEINDYTQEITRIDSTIAFYSSLSNKEERNISTYENEVCIFITPQLGIIDLYTIISR